MFYFTVLVMITSILSWSLFPNKTMADEQLADGTYTIQYTVLHAENDSASMANDYWEKPATITVANGQMKAQMTINHSSWVTEFKVTNNGGFQDVTVISADEAADKRVVEFPISSLSTPLESKIHVTVEDIDYDHDYTIRLSFDLDSLQTVSLAESASNETEVTTDNTTSTNGETSNNTESGSTENPETSDNHVIMWGALMLAALTVLAFTRFNKASSSTN
ncbi:heme uptake protein IsdC [Salipaludibacillus agaradhaerens]|uniref:Heme uptake protein IsdC n=2 Tax=Salipaludibacillus agaradhaerens TaxID=76935 RepID=A0A9Q4AZR5_SALAG|nr:heme uptake protein IsdC [Salipaludibacillus agaradhaerens]MCR6114756.1 heme uptake protein IsdC [Salipaludibacillus agaradhaerens]